MVDTIPVRSDEHFDTARVEAFLRQRLPGQVDAPLEVQQFPAGQSNLTYLVRSGHWEGVLRRPPLGPVAPRAHDMEREFHILERLHAVFPLAPRPYVLCQDTAVIGAPFYVMERRRGLVLDRSLPPGWDTARNGPISEALIQTLVDLHQVDWQAAGLGEIGRPEGYLQRQVTGWIQRYQRVQTEEVPELAALTEWLVARLPPSPPATIVHNDYKLNNVMLDPTDPTRLVAVLDWEMTTVGDPLSDVAAMLVYWEEPGEAEGMEGLGSATAEPGFFQRPQVAEVYQRLSGRDLSLLDWHMPFAYFKVGVICQQIYYRWKVGQTRDERFADHGQVGRSLIRRAAALAGITA